MTDDKARELTREIKGTCHYFDVDHDGSISHTESPNCFDWKPLPTELSTKIAQVIKAHETSYAQKTSALWRWACTCGRIETVETREACVSATHFHWGYEVAALLRPRLEERWEPMGTAPKDGREVLLHVKYRAGIPYGTLVQPSAGEKPRIHPSNFSAEEWRLVKLLGAVGGEWPWHMTDAEYKLVGEALKRVGVIKETDATQR